jgi:predicted RNA-binding Zn-ribbon protein involved in translation (DUF1610 family)
MTHDQSCPLCNMAAQFSQIDLQRKHFKCSSCGEYLLWREAEKWLNGRATTTLEHYAKYVRANQGPDVLYVISAPLPDSPPHIEIEGNARSRSEALAS